MSLNQAVGVGRPELKPLERGKSLDEGGSLQEGGGHAGLLWGFLLEGSRAGLGRLLQEEAMLRRGNFLVREFYKTSLLKTDRAV